MRSFSISILIAIMQISLFAQKSAITFKDISAESGVNVSHVSTAENRYILESMSGGAAVFDCDGDGFLDVATVVGSSVENYKKGGDLFLALYRQIDGAASKIPKFENITASANLTKKGWGMGITAVDYDSDGILDLFATGFGSNVLYRGKGGCKFEDATDRAGIKGVGFQTGSAWADYDRDGDLDVFIPGYVSLDLNNLPVMGSSKTCSYRGIRVQCGPRGLTGERDYFYQNNGDGTFREISQKIGLSDEGKFFGLGVTFADYDNDGWLDLFVANDSLPNFLYKNKKDGTFTDVSFQSGTSYSGDGGEQSSMGVSISDYDNDGRLDIFVTNFESEANTLYQNKGIKGFVDISTQAGTALPAKPFVGWGTAFTDFDNDGFLDLLIANGHVYPQMELVKNETIQGFRQPILLHRNLGNGKFEDISKESGLRDLPMFSGRGAAFGDLNNDGLVDVVIVNLGEKPQVLLNTTQNKNKKILVRLIESGKNHDAIGARVTVKTENRSMIQEVQAGASYLSQNDHRLHFGFPEGEKIMSAEIRWSSGNTETISTIESNRIVAITEKKGITNSVVFR